MTFQLQIDKNSFQFHIIYVGMNPIKEGAYNRTKENIVDCGSMWVLSKPNLYHRRSRRIRVKKYILTWDKLRRGRGYLECRTSCPKAELARFQSSQIRCLRPHSKLEVTGELSSIILFRRLRRSRQRPSHTKLRSIFRYT